MMASISPSPVICFIDVDSFECQIYQRDEPLFRGTPCVVANSSGRIVASSYEAKKMGISRKTTVNLKQATKICPSLHVFRKINRWGKQDSRKTRLASYEIVDCVKEFFQATKDVFIEVASSDEIYLDVSALVTQLMESRRNLSDVTPFLQMSDRVVWIRKHTKEGPFKYSPPKWDNPFYRGKEYIYQKQMIVERLMFGAQILNCLLDEIEEKTGLVAAGGVGSNRLLAKVACEMNRPQKITVCPQHALWDDHFGRYPGKGEDIVASRIPITHIPGLKGSTGDKLRAKFGVNVLMDIQRVPLGELINTFGSELAHKVFNWSKGEDNEPVVNKQTRDIYRCNKPADRRIGDLTELKQSLKDLCEEITELLQEERSRNNRTVPCVRVEFSSAGLSNSTEFKVATQMKPQHLEETIISSVCARFDGDEGFPVTKLSFVLRNFISIDAETQNGETGKSPVSDLPDSNSLEGIMHRMILNFEKGQDKKNLRTCAPPSKSLKVYNNKNTGVCWKFLGQVGAFRTSLHNSSSMQETSVELPKLLSFDELKKIENVLLPDVKDMTYLPSIAVTNHALFCEFKHKSFAEWLGKNYKDCVCEEKGQVDFVTFSGRIADPLQSPLVQFGDSWEIYAINVAGVIYLWEEKVKRPEGPRTAASIYGFAFEKIVTGGLQKDLIVDENEMDTVYSVDKVNLGSHKLLLLSQVNAETAGTKERAQIALYSSEYRKNYLKTVIDYRLYAQCLTSGSSIVVVGTRKNDCLLNVQTFTLEEFVQENNLGEVQKCPEFQNRFLSWMKSHLPESNPSVVKKFSWISGAPDVKWSLLPEPEIPLLVVPRLYATYFETVLQNSK